jgi:hypothetical protein
MSRFWQQRMMQSNAGPNSRAPRNHPDDAVRVKAITNGDQTAGKPATDLRRFPSKMSIRLVIRIWNLVRSPKFRLGRNGAGRVTERIELVNVPGIGRMYRHTFRGDNGEHLPNVAYTDGPEPVLEHRAASAPRTVEG